MKNNQFKNIALCLSILLVSGCSYQTLLINPQNADKDVNYQSNATVGSCINKVGDVCQVPTYHEFSSFYFPAGLAQESKINPASICGSIDNVDRVVNYKSFVDMVVTGFSFGIYTPSTTRIYCIK
ncbi:MAG: hypothetical protein QM538_05910 [Methylacidiphilales bacterium]|nr:hypothetical protein [Candidatus Methylacidiphilales bacterium]